MKTPIFLRRAGSAAIVAALFIALAGHAHADLPISGRPVPALSQLDTIMSDFMNDSTRTISAGVLGVSRGGRIVFVHGYGHLTPSINLPENAIMRMASVTKPVTAAAIHRFSQNGGLGATQLQRRAFNLSGNGGVLTVTLPPSTPIGDARYSQITVGQLLNHSAGFDNNPQPTTNPFLRDFPLTQVRNAGIQMNEPDALPSRTQLMGYALQFPLAYAPGAATYTRPANPTPPGMPATNFVPGPGGTYSNFGYLILGEILEATAPGGYAGYVGSQILSAENWIPLSEWSLARSLAVNSLANEPPYVGTSTTDSVFDYTAPIDQLPYQYGGQHIETMMAHGGIRATAAAMLRFGNLFNVFYTTQGAGATQTNDLGLPLSSTLLMPSAGHTGSLVGVNTILRQVGNGGVTDDDVVIYIAFNERTNATDWATDAYNAVIGYLGTLTAEQWPTEKCDGFWINVGAESPLTGSGGYHAPLQGFASALGQMSPGSYMRLRGGSQNWTGTITKRVQIDAPEGPVTLGQ